MGTHTWVQGLSNIYIYIFLWVFEYQVRSVGRFRSISKETNNFSTSPPSEGILKAYTGHYAYCKGPKAYHVFFEKSMLTLMNFVVINCTCFPIFIVLVFQTLDVQVGDLRPPPSQLAQIFPLTQKISECNVGRATGYGIPYCTLQRCEFSIQQVQDSSLCILDCLHIILCKVELFFVKYDVYISIIIVA